MIAIAGVELETLVSEPDALTTRPPPQVTSTIVLGNDPRAMKSQYKYYYFLRLILKLTFFFLSKDQFAFPIKPAHHQLTKL